ncbi:MAG: phosphoribosylformylglycinamidine synthase, partial [Candidatus Omnitrophota bacterium]
MVKVCVLRTAGTNCDVETAFAFEQEGAVSDLVHINEILSNRRNLNDYQILAIPGGFTYGDDIAAGKLLANEIRYLLWEEIQEFVHRGNLVIGICNGFQVLVKAGILPECDGNQIATLAWN